MPANGLKDFLSRVQALSTFSDDQLTALANAAEVRSYEVNDPVFEQGASGEGLYIVQSGSFRLYETRDGIEQTSGIRREGELLGEIGALKDTPLDNSTRSASTSSLIIVPRDTLAEILKKEAKTESFFKQFIVISATGNFISRFMQLHENTSLEDMERIVTSIGIKRIKAGQAVLEQGATSDQRLYVVQSGQIHLQKTLHDNDYTVALLEREDIFGEDACLNRAPQGETAIVDRDAIVLVIPAESIRFMIERNPSLKEFLEGRIAQRKKELDRQVKLNQRRHPRILLDLVTPKKNRDKVLRYFPMVEEYDDRKSSAACISMICQHYEIPVDPAKLADMLVTSGKTPDMDTMARIGESLGFACRAITCNIKMMQTFDLPFVANWKGHRFVVVYGISKKNAWLADPAEGFKKISIKEFTSSWDGVCLTFIPSQAVQKHEASENPWIRFVRMLVPQRRMVRDIILATIVMELLGLISPLLTQAVVDKVLVHSNLSLLNVLIFGAFMALLFTHSTRIIRSYLINFLIRRMDFNMMAGFYKHILALPLSFFAQRKVGEIMACFSENAKIRRFLTYTAITAVMNIFMFLVYLAVMFMFNTELSLVFLVFIPILALLTAFATPRFAANARRNFFAQTSARTVLAETLGSSASVKSLGFEVPMRKRWEEKYAHAVNLQYDAEYFASKIRIAGLFIRQVMALALLWYGARLVIDQKLSVGQLMAFIQIVGCVMAPLMALISSWNEMYETGVSIERIGEVMEMEPEQNPLESTSRTVLPRVKGHYIMKNVSYAYVGAEYSPTLKNISLELEPGKTYGLVGASGSGKTTLTRLLAGVYAPTEGAVLVDRHNLTNIDLPHYRAQIGYVMQESNAFSGTFAGNIAFGDSSPDYVRIEQVTEVAGLSHVVNNNPLRYEMKLGDKGGGLSTGEIQRLSIARALYNDPPFLVLDEPTASLEDDVEERIFKKIKESMGDRTTLIVSHRLSTIMNADKIFVMVDGAIAEEGTHSELLEKNGMYRTLMKKQLYQTKYDRLTKGHRSH